MNTKKLLNVLYTIFSVFVIGIAFPTLVSAFVALSTKATFSDAVECAGFWVFSVVMWIVSSICIIDNEN
jgi:hypothetical protein